MSVIQFSDYRVQDEIRRKYKRTQYHIIILIFNCLELKTTSFHRITGAAESNWVQEIFKEIKHIYKFSEVKHIKFKPVKIPFLSNISHSPESILNR